METTIFLGIVGLFRLATGLVLLRLALQKQLPNLRWLAVGFIITVVDIPFTAQPYVPFVDKTLSYFAYLCYAVFIARTFYKDRPSPLVPFWTVFTLLYLVMYVLTVLFMTEATGLGFPQHLFEARPPYENAPMGVFETIDSVIYGTLQIAIWLWHAIAGFQANRRIAGEAHVEDWIKGRYQMVIAYSILQSLIGVVMILRPFTSSIIIIFSALLVVGTTSLQFLVWVMPEWFRKWLNRNQQARNEEMIQAQALSILHIIGAVIADVAGVSKLIALVSLRKCIGSQLQTEDQRMIERRALEMGYDEWQALLGNPELYSVIASSSTKLNLPAIQEKARRALIEKQSLFTMQSR